MIIDGVKYRDVYFKDTVHFKATVHFEAKGCLVCQKNFNKGDEVFLERTIWVTDLDNEKKYNGIYGFCLKCGKTAKKAERTAIPLLKILYGGTIQVCRINKKTNEEVIFYY